MSALPAIEWVERFSYPAVVLLCWACGLGAPLSEDLIVLTGGALVGSAGASFPLMALSAFVGQVGGDWLLFRIGHRFGPRALTLPGVRHVLTPERCARLGVQLALHGGLVVAAVRFLPGLRAPTYLAAGIFQVPVRRFLLADAGAAAVFAPLLVYLGYRVGPLVLGWLESGARTALVAAVSLAALVWLLRAVRRSRRQERVLASSAGSP